MDAVWTFLEHFGLSIAGLLIYSLWQIRQHLKRFSIRVFIHDNRPFWIWALLLQIIFAMIVTFLPDSAPAIKTIVGIDLTEPMAFLTSGSALAGAANWAAGAEENKIGMAGKIRKE